MKVICQTVTLYDSISEVSSLVPSRTTIPALSNVLITADKSDTLNFITTDLEISMIKVIEAKIKEKGSLSVNAKRLVNVLRGLQAAETELTADKDNILNINCGSSFFKINGLPADDFPSINQPSDGVTFSISSAVLYRMFKLTHYAASTDESRRVLNGILLNLKDRKLLAVSTDGRRLAMVEQEIEPLDSLKEIDIILPTKAVNILMHSIKDIDENIQITFEGKKIAFSFSGTTIISQLIEGTYPSFRQVIPTQFEECITLERETLISALKRVSSILDTGFGLGVRFCFQKGKLELIAESPDTGEARETISIKYNGKPIEISFNPQFILDALTAVESDEVHIELTDALSPGVIKTDIPFVYVVMPIRPI